MKALYGLADSEMGNRSQEFWDRVHPADIPALRLAVGDHLDRHSEQIEEECRVLHADGSWRWLYIRGRAQFGADAKPRRLVGIMTDVTERKEREAQLQAAYATAEVEHARARHAADHDPLTGLPNRSYFSARMTALAADAERKRCEVAVMVLDLDGFKEVNDTLGHLGGDEVLVAAARRMKGCMRDGDIVARLGGDEFAVLMPHANGDVSRNAAILAERLIAAVGRDITVENQPVRIGCSIGLAIYTPGGLAIEGMLKRADEALYAAKRAGKGRMVSFDNDMPQHFDRPVLLAS